MDMAFAGEAWALFTYGCLEASGLNGAIGVLALGFTLANLNLLPEWMMSKVNNAPVTMNDMSLLSEITFLLRTFVSVIKLDLSSAFLIVIKSLFKSGGLAI